MKKTVSLLLICILLLTAVLSGCAPEKNDGGLHLRFNAYGHGEDACDTVEAYRKTDTDYYLFLPGGTELSSLVMWVDAPGKIMYDGKPLTDGKAPFDREDSYALSCGEKEVTLTVMRSSDIPALFVSTESGSLDAVHADKEYKEKAGIAIAENGRLTAETTLSYIKGRGNQTWMGEKRPYNIKFDEKISLFGMEEAKKYCLLANAEDDTLIRNSFALTLAQQIGIPYAVDFQPVDLYINGDYRGSYLLTEKIEAGQGRAEITDLDKLNEKANPGVDIGALDRLREGEISDCGGKRWTDIPVSPDDITGGYLIEYDGETYYDKEDNGFCSSGGQYVTVKSPEHASKTEIDYISSFCSEAEQALSAENGVNSLGKHYSEYYDTDALARLFVLNEFLINSDCGFSSTFFTKAEEGGKLVAGPAWDFDTCMQPGRTDGIRYVFRPENWCTNLLCMNRYNMDTTVFEQAFRHTDFREKCAEIWKENRDILSGKAASELIVSLAEEIKFSAAADRFRWAPVIVSPQKWTELYVGNTAKLCEFLPLRAAALDKGLLGKTAMLYYDLNGAYGWMFSEKIAVEGESVSVKDIGEDAFLPVEPGNGLTFTGWNTRSDGSGTGYQPGDEIKLSSPDTILYAQWSAD